MTQNSCKKFNKCVLNRKSLIMSTPLTLDHPSIKVLGYVVMVDPYFKENVWVVGRFRGSSFKSRDFWELSLL